jgi:galactoside O-acetyltransferase
MAPVDPATLGLAAVGEDVTIYPLAKLLDPERITVGSHVIIDDFVLLQGGGGLEIGNHVHVAAFASVMGAGPTRLGHFCSISQGARLVTGTDVLDGPNLVNSTIPPRLRRTDRPGIQIGDFAVVGANATVLPGLTVGAGAVVGGGSVVVEDLEPWTIYAGVPARPLRERPADPIEQAETLGYPFRG